MHFETNIHYIVSYEDAEYLLQEIRFIRFPTVTVCFFLRPLSLESDNKALPFVKFSDRSYSVHLPNTVR